MKLALKVGSSIIPLHRGTKIELAGKYPGTYIVDHGGKTAVTMLKKVNQNPVSLKGAKAREGSYAF